MIMKKIFLSIMMILLVSTAFAQSPRLDEETKKICNEVMTAIFTDILAAKNRYDGLSGFDNPALTQNQYGIYAINYKNQDPNSRSYEVGLTILGIDDPSPYAKKEGNFALGFPFLKLKFVGYQMRTMRSRQLDVEGLIQRYGQRLSDYQQKYMPLKLVIERTKDTYKTGEPIEFTVSLKNTSMGNLVVKDLTDSTLFFLYNNRAWGATEVNPGTSSAKQIILKHGESISKRYRGNGFSSPKEFEIYVSYGMTFQGVKPTNTMKVKVGP